MFLPLICGAALKVCFQDLVFLRDKYDAKVSTLAAYLWRISASRLNLEVSVLRDANFVDPHHLNFCRIQMVQRIFYDGIYES